MSSYNNLALSLTKPRRLAFLMLSVKSGATLAANLLFLRSTFLRSRTQMQMSIYDGL